MITILRKIRRRLLSHSKMGSYVLYALGEIVLVVIGILIALQINSWNNEIENRKLEQVYLADIRTNLIIDRTEAEGGIGFNNYKFTVIDSVMNLVNNAEDANDYMYYLIEQQRTLGSFPTFDPVSTTFDNMKASHSLNIVENKELRVLLSEYYNYDWEKSPQSVSRTRTRTFADILLTKMVDKSSYHQSFASVYEGMMEESNNFSWGEEFTINFQDPGYLEFHQDREAIAAMLHMVSTGIYHNRYIREKALDRIDRILEIIDQAISD